MSPGGRRISARSWGHGEAIATFREAFGFELAAQASWEVWPGQCVRASSGVQGGLCSSWRLRGMARPCDNRPSGTPRAYEAHPVERLVPRYDR